MYRQILISLILLVNLFVLPATLNARVMQERVGLTIKEEQLMPEISTIINRKKRVSKFLKGAAIAGGLAVAGAVAYKAYKNYKKNQEQQAAGTTGRK
ncbi:unnamed protein product [Meloidogyne enterolobii]|uniref:Uncharacterized protein n=1 Tax=Meloidogyne enterolobii TaxID=390850 RepID=A0ACB0YBR9_MELEN